MGKDIKVEPGSIVIDAPREVVVELGTFVGGILTGGLIERNFVMKCGKCDTSIQLSPGETEPVADGFTCDTCGPFKEALEKSMGRGRTVGELSDTQRVLLKRSMRPGSGKGL